MSETPPFPTATAEEARALAAVDAEETVSLLQDLIRANSENPPGREEATARILGKFFERHGIDHRFEEIAPGRPNLIAELGPSGGPALILNGHTDTVPIGEGWTFDPLGGEVADGRIYGRGATDMLGGVAAMSMAAAAVKRSGIELRGRLMVHAVIDEEVDAIGSQHAARNAQADWVIVTESSAGMAEVYGKGQLNVEITFRGKAAHSSTPGLGRNAIHDAAAFTMLVESEHEQAASSPYPKVGPVTYAVAIIEGGTNGSIIPAECTLTLDRRLLPTETLEEAEAAIQKLLDRLAEQRPGLDASMRATLLFPPLPPVEDNELAAAIQGATKSLTGVEAGLSGATGATDASWYAARGMPAVIFGPGDGETAHQPDEFLAIEDLHQATRVLTLTCVRLLAAGTGAHTKEAS